MTKFTKILAAVAMLWLVAVHATPLMAQQYSFKVGQLYYKIIDAANRKVAVVPENSRYPYYNNEPTGAVTIPAMVAYGGNNHSVTSIGEYAFFGCNGITFVNITNGITSIGESAFSNCRGLTSINIPNSVTSIGRGAFFWSKGLTSITIPSSVTSIGESAFAGCTSLASVTLSHGLDSIGSSNNYYYSGGVFAGCTLLTSINIPNSVRYIGKNAFSGCSGLTSINIPNSVTSIEYGAFSGCSGLTAITIPSSVTSIGKHAFSYCSGFTSITIPNSVTKIEDGAFYNCTSLASVNLPHGLDSIGSSNFNYYRDHGVFEDCTSLTSINIPNSVIYIGKNTFKDCTGLISINIPNSVTSIDSAAFYDCSGLTSITIPNSVTSIGYSAFEYCSRLTSITVPNSVTSIGHDAFGYCSRLRYVTIPGHISFKDNFGTSSDIDKVIIAGGSDSICDFSFESCSKIKYISIPNSVTSIGYMAFAGCTGLTAVVVGWQTPLQVDSNVFDGVTLNSVRLIVPASRESIYRAADVWKRFCPIVETANYTISYDQSTGGTFRLLNDSQEITTGSSVISGVVLTVEATPNIGYQVDSIKVNGTHILGLSFMVTSNSMVEVYFSKIIHIISHIPPANGTLIIKDGSQTIYSGDSVEYGKVLTVEATPDQGYKLDGILVNGVRISGFSFTVNGNSIVEAYFSKTRHAISYTQPANGTLTLKNGSQTILSGDSVEHGTVLTIEATPAEYYKLDSILVNGVHISGLSFTVDTNSTVEAYFSKMKYMITYTQPTNGTLTVKNGSQTILSGDSVEYGDSLTIEATAIEHYKLDNMRINGIPVSGINGISITGFIRVDANITLEVYFSKMKYMVTYTQPANGTLTVRNGSQTIHSGDSVEYDTYLTIEATPAQGYKLDSIKVNDARIAGGSFTVDSNSTVEAYFSKMKYTITYTQPTNGTLTVKNGQQTILSGDSLEYGTVLTIKDTPAQSYKLDSIRVNGTRISGLSFMVEDNTTIEAFFSKVKHIITYNQLVGGTLTLKNGSQTILSGDSVEHGTMLTVEATPAQGYRLDSVRVNGVRISGLSFTVTSSSVVEVYFSKPLFTISYNQSAGGTFKVKNGSQEVASGSSIEYGTVLTFEATADEHYKFDSIRVNGARISGLSFTVTDNTNIEVFFGKQSYTVTYNSNMYSGKIEVTRGSEIVASGSSVEYGTQLTVKAIPNPGFEVKSLTINDQAIVNNFVFSISEAVEIKAVFAPATTALDEAATKPLALYPNPVAEVLYLSATARTIRIYDMYGTEVVHATDTDKVEVSHLPAGIYTVIADGSIAKMIKR